MKGLKTSQCSCPEQHSATLSNRKRPAPSSPPRQGQVPKQSSILELRHQLLQFCADQGGPEHPNSWVGCRWMLPISKQWNILPRVWTTHSITTDLPAGVICPNSCKTVLPQPSLMIMIMKKKAHLVFPTISYLKPYLIDHTVIYKLQL